MHVPPRLLRIEPFIEFAREDDRILQVQYVPCSIHWPTEDEIGPYRIRKRGNKTGRHRPSEFQSSQRPSPALPIFIHPSKAQIHRKGLREAADPCRQFESRPKPERKPRRSPRLRRHCSLKWWNAGSYLPIRRSPSDTSRGYSLSESRISRPDYARATQPSTCRQPVPLESMNSTHSYQLARTDPYPLITPSSSDFSGAIDLVHARLEPRCRSVTSGSAYAWGSARSSRRDRPSSRERAMAFSRYQPVLT